MPKIPETNYNIDDMAMYDAINYCIRAKNNREKRGKWQAEESPYVVTWDTARAALKYKVDVHILRYHLKKISSTLSPLEAALNELPKTKPLRDKEIKIEELNDSMESIWKQLYALKMKIRQWL